MWNKGNTCKRNFIFCHPCLFGSFGILIGIIFLFSKDIWNWFLFMCIITIYAYFFKLIKFCLIKDDLFSILIKLYFIYKTKQYILMLSLPLSCHLDLLNYWKGGGGGVICVSVKWDIFLYCQLFPFLSCNSNDMFQFVEISKMISLDFKCYFYKHFLFIIIFPFNVLNVCLKLMVLIAICICMVTFCLFFMLICVYIYIYIYIYINIYIYMQSQKWPSLKACYISLSLCFHLIL